MKEAKKDLSKRYSYQTRYFDDVDKLKESILNKTIIPHQVEVQPGPENGNLCWLNCPYCYGHSAQETGERLAPERYLEIMKQIAAGGVNKIVFAGYATDPLNYEHIEDLLQIAIDNKQIFGFHTKALKLSDRFIEQISIPSITPLSYFSVSVDAGNNKTYNMVHGISQSKAKLYDNVRKNVSRVVNAREKTGAPLDVSVTYLINGFNNSVEEVTKAINDFRSSGADLIRFTFPQIPRGYSRIDGDPNIPSSDDIAQYMKHLRSLINAENGDRCQILLYDLDAQYGTYLLPRTLPCFARFIFPSLGYDGWLSHCSESAAPHFRQLALGNLNKRDFWDVYYDYDVSHLSQYFKTANSKMEQLSCKCDRKEHVVNSRIRDSKVFEDV